LLDSEDKENLNIFFDDNIREDRANIVAAYDIKNMENVINFDLTKGMELITAETPYAILDDYYYIKKMYEAEEKILNKYKN